MTTAHEQSKPGEVDDFLAGGGEMGALMRSIDWSQTPMGAVEIWPQSLRTAISIMLASRFAMVVAWGPEFRFFYNDRYRPVLGASKHPGALGAPAQEIFPEAWPFIGPLFESTRQGESVALDDVLIPLDRYGYLENCYFTLSYSPIRAESGGVGGMLAVVAETTERVEGERRLSTLRELAQRPTGARTVEEACKSVAEALGENPIDAPFSLFYLVDPDGDCARLAAAAGLPGGTGASLTTIDLTNDAADGWPLASVARSRKARVVEELALRFGDLPGGPYPEPTHTAVVTPMMRPGQKHLDGLIVFGVSPRRALDERYMTFIELATDQTLTAIRNARAYEDERKRAEALAEIDRAKTAFFSNVSHEFRTPLTLMLGPLEDTLAQSDGLPTAARERLEVAHRNSMRLLKLVNTLLDFSRIEAGRTQAAYEPTDLAAFTAELASVFRSAIERAGLRFLVNCPSLEELVYVDREMWEKVVLNLLSNAFKFTFEGEIEVSLREAGEMVELAVRDSGTGIPAAELPHVFERFHRVKGARGRTYEGSGIGLALVQELVKLHSGAVRVESGVDRGSTFIVTIPRGSAHLPADRIGAMRKQVLQGEAYVEEALRWLPDSNFGLPILDFGLTASDATSPEDNHQADESKIQNPKSKILLADDNADMREYVRRLLSQEYEVIAVNDGAAALRAAREHTPDLVLTDVMMPGLDGFGLLRELRADERLKAIPVIMLSARAGEESRIEGLAEGADDYLVKPFSARELLARVESHLKLQRVRHQWEAALRASESKFSAAFEQSPLALTITSLADGRLVEVNESFLRLSGYTREEALGRTPEELKLWVEPKRHAEGLKQLRAGAGSVGVEARFRKKSGAELFGVIRATLIEINSRPHVVSSIADITERKRAEEALRETEHRFTMFMQNLPGLAWIKDIEGRYVYANAAAELAFRKPQAELFGKTDEELFPPETAAQFRENDRQVLADGAGIQIIETLEHEDGLHHSIVSKFPIWGPDSHPAMIGGVAIDITERRQAEQRLVTQHTVTRVLAEATTLEEASPKILQAVCESLVWDFGTLWGLDREAGVLRCRESWHRQSVGVTEFEAISRARTFQPGIGLPGQVWASRKPVYIADVVHDANFPRAPFAARAGLHAAFGFPILFSGEVLGVMEFFSHEMKQADADLLNLMATIGSQIGQFIERKQAEEALRESEERFAKAFNSSPLSLTISSLKTGKLIEVNETFINVTGYARAEALGRTTVELGLWANLQDREAEMEVVRQAGQVRNAEYIFKRKNGEDIIGLLSAERIELGGEPYALTVIQDITERKRAEQALREADRRKDEFLAMLAHELRNPLAPIRNAAQVLKLVGPSDANQQWAREVIERQTQHLTKLVDDLLDVSRITQGKVTLQRGPLDLATIINRALETSRPLLDAHKHHLTVELPPAPIQVEGDLTRLVQVVGNLLNNAAKYTDDGGHVRLQATLENGEAVIRVRDDGMGLPADLLPHVFDLFTQADRSLDRSEGGLGIGLTLVRQLVELHGGRVEAKSDGPGQGSEFIVRLPALSPSLAASTTAAADEQVHPPPQKLRVLVVEDNLDSAEMLAFMLGLDGHEVRIAHDGPEALEIAFAFKPQAVLCDIGLPGMNGYEVGARLREQAAFKQTPLIALTGYGQEEARRRAKEVGFDFHIVKPVEPDALSALLDSLLQRAGDQSST